MERNNTNQKAYDYAHRHRAGPICLLSEAYIMQMEAAMIITTQRMKRHHWYSSSSQLFPAFPFIPEAAAQQ
jgi:hypothetical protein